MHITQIETVASRHTDIDGHTETQSEAGIDRTDTDRRQRQTDRQTDMDTEIEDRQAWTEVHLQ